MRTPASLVFLLLIAVAGITAGITLVVIALKNSPGLVRSDYYQEGLKLDEHRAQEAAFDSLGFTLVLREEYGALIVEASDGPADDADAAARLGAFDLVLELRRPDDPSADRDIAMTYASDVPPLWVADASLLRRGLWNVRAVYRERGAADSSTADARAIRMEYSFEYIAPGGVGEDGP